MADAVCSADVQVHDLWVALNDDFQQASDSLASGILTPNRAWKLLSKALSKHTNIATYPAPRKRAVPLKLPQLLCNIIARILNDYKYYQDTRLGELCHLCKLTTQLYAICTDPNDIGIRLELAKQSAESKVIDAVSKSLRQATPDLTATARSAGGGRSSRGKATAAIQAMIACDQLAASIQLHCALLQLFHAVNSIWPGQAGILTSQKGGEAAVASVTAADAMLGAVIVAADLGALQPAALVHFTRCAMESVSLVAQQLQTRLWLGQPSSADKQLIDSSQLLSLVLLLLGLHMSSGIAAAPICSSCGSVSMIVCTENAIIDSTAADASTSCDSSGRLLLEETARNNKSGPDNPFITLMDSDCTRCSSKHLLLSILGSRAAAEASAVAVHRSIWQGAVAGAASSGLSKHHLLQLLEKLLSTVQERIRGASLCLRNDAAGKPLDNADVMSCKILAPVLVTALEAARLAYNAQQQQLTAAAAAAARAAAKTWYETSMDRAGYWAETAMQSRDRFVGPYGPYETRCLPEIVSLAAEIMQHMVQPSGVSAGEAVQASSDSSPSSSSGSSSRDDDHRHGHPGAVGSSSTSCPASCAGLFSVLKASVDSVYALLYTNTPQTTILPAWRKELQPAVVAAEACIRAAGFGAAAAGGVISLKQLLTALTDALYAGCECLGGGKNSHGRPCWIPFEAYKSGLAAAPLTAAAAGHAPAAQATTAGVSPEDKQLYALLLSSCKLANGHCQAETPSAITAAATAVINSFCQNKQPPPATLLPTAMPWLYVMARAVIVGVKLITAELEAFPQRAAALAAATAGSTAEQREAELNVWNRGMHTMFGALPRLSEFIRPFASSDHQQQLAEPQAAAAAGASAVLQPQLVQLLQDWDSSLLREVQQAELLLWFVVGISYYDVDQQGMSSATAAVAQQAAAMSGTDKVQQYSDRLRVVLSSSLIQDLPQQLEAAALQLCALLPLPLCCNNPSCSNMSRQSELQLVGGKSCVCAGCEVARYCGRECQGSHWQAHKKVCKMIRKSKVRAGSSSS